MEKIRVRKDPIRVKAFLLSLGMGVMLMAYPLWSDRLGGLMAIPTLWVRALMALPEILWWIIAGLILTFWGLAIIFRWGEKAGPGRKKPAPAVSFYGDLRWLRGTLSQAGSGRYFQDKVRQRVRTLAVNLISLRQGLPEEQALEQLREGAWTRDEVLKEYLKLRQGFDLRGRFGPLHRWFKPRPQSLFLQETEDVLNRLQSYISSIDGRQRDDVTNLTPGPRGAEERADS